MLTVFLGLLLGQLYMEENKQEALPDFLVPYEKLLVEGEVYKVTEKSFSYEVSLKNTYIIYNNKSYPCQGILVYLDTYPFIKIGNRIQVNGSLEEFSTPRNEGEFHQLSYYKSKKIDYKMKGECYEVIDEKYSIILDFLNHIKITIKNSYYKICNEKEYGIFSAIILGETGDMDSEINNLYKANGISHILSISGLHISMIGMCIYKLLRKRFYFGFSSLISSVFILAYVALTGFSVSAIRAFLMFSISLIASYMGRTYDMISATSLAAMILLFDNPYLVYNVGFLLSFGAVFGISIIHPILMSYLNQKNPILSAVLISLSVNLMTLPILAYYFFETSTYSLILNLLIIPPMSMLMVSGILGGIIGTWSPFLGKLAIGSGHYVLAFYEEICRIFSKFPKSRILIGRPQLWQILVYYLILFFLLYYMKKKEELLSFFEKMSRICLVFFIYAALIGVLSIRIKSGLRVTFLDLSQGEGIFIESDAGTRYFIDGGSTDVKKIGTYRIIPFLKANGIGSIDYAMVTHADTDHISGLKEMLEEESGIQIQTLILPKIEEKDVNYLDLEDLARERGVSIAYMEAGDAILEDGLEITCIHPSSNYIGESINGYSTVLSVSYGEFDMLLTGDLEMDGEEMVLEEVKGLGIDSYEVLKVPHHGSKNSTSEEFLSLINPRVSIISSGIDNSYGHPHKELLERLRDVGTEIFLTSECGGITIRTDGEKMEIERTIEYE